MSTPDPRLLRWRDSTWDRTADRAGLGPGTTRGAWTLLTSLSTLRGTPDTMQALTVSRRATQGSTLGGMETPASILDLTVMGKMVTLDSTLEEMEKQGSTKDQRETNRMETQGSTLGGMGVCLLVLQGSEPPSSLLRTMSWRM